MFSFSNIKNILPVVCLLSLTCCHKSGENSTKSIEYKIPVKESFFSGANNITRMAVAVDGGSWLSVRKNGSHYYAADGHIFRSEVANLWHSTLQLEYFKDVSFPENSAVQRRLTMQLLTADGQTDIYTFQQADDGYFYGGKKGTSGQVIDGAAALAGWQDFSSTSEQYFDRRVNPFPLSNVEAVTIEKNGTVRTWQIETIKDEIPLINGLLLFLSIMLPATPPESIAACPENGQQMAVKLAIAAEQATTDFNFCIIDNVMWAGPDKHKYQRLPQNMLNVMNGYIQKLLDFGTGSVNGVN